MKTKLLFLSAALLAGFAVSAHADSVTGEILGYDRKAELIILSDKTVWSLRDHSGEIPEGLKAGDKVRIETEDGGEDGIGRVTAIAIVE